jgi:alginate O-acetyltransferase complex protein AlgI
MSFISAGFFMVMALTACLYYLIPKKYQWELLLFVSFGFYATYGIRYMGYILFTIITSYCITRLMAAQEEKLMRRRWLIFGLFSNFGILVFLKYVNFTILNLTSLFSVFHQAFPLGKLSIVMPLGISFYTFQTMSYVIDVYQKKYEPETNIFRLALFTAYLPQLLQGPIGRYDRLAPQLFEPHDFNLKNIEYGAQRIAWGLAKKLILADRAYVFSKAVFADLNTYSGMYVIVALLTFSIYEYCDFSGGIDVVIGVSELFGIRLDENFRQPYFSKSIGEFWRRWHITLGTWMKDYIFYPFSISKKMLAFGKKAKKIFGKKTGKILPICAANLLIFFVVGVWHGAAWKYIIYGLYNGLIIAASNLLKPYYAKWAAVCHVNTESRGWKTFQIFRTFILVNIGWLFDACATATTAFYAMRAVFINFKISILTDGSLYKLGLVKRDWTILIVATIILFISSVMKEKGMSLRDFVAERPFVVRWAVYLILIFATAPFGYVSSSTEFMYAQF